MLIGIKMWELIIVLKVKKLHKVQIKTNMTNLSITSILINVSFLISLISGFGKLWILADKKKTKHDLQWLIVVNDKGKECILPRGVDKNMYWLLTYECRGFLLGCTSIV